MHGLVLKGTQLVGAVLTFIPSSPPCFLFMLRIWVLCRTLAACLMSLLMAYGRPAGVRARAAGVGRPR